MGTPITRPMTTEIRPMPREMRAPKRMRLNRSRPSSSVPNQCRAEGPLRALFRSVSIGSWEAMKGAKIAHRRNRAMMPRPSMAVRFFRR